MFSFLPNQLQNIQFSERQYSQRYDYYNRFHTKSSSNITGTLTLDCQRITTTSIMTDIKNICTGQFKQKQGSVISKFAEKFIQIFLLSQQNNTNQSPLKNKSFPLQVIQSTKEQQDGYIDSKINNKYTEIHDNYQNVYKEIEKQIQQSQTNDMIQIQIQASMLSLFKFYQIYLEKNMTGKVLSQKYYPIKSLLDKVFWKITDLIGNSCLVITQNILTPDNLFLHPLMIPLLTFIQYKKSITSQSIPVNQMPIIEKCPKIAFINLDGNDSPLNTYLACSSQSFFYFSIYYQRQKSNQDTEILEQALSQAMFKFKKHTFSKGSNVMQIPLHSKFIKRKMQMKYQQQQKMNQKITSLIGQSEDIYYIFKELIQPQIIQWKPLIIVLSYSGELKIKPIHFNQIIKSLTIYSQHRVILFPNLPKIQGQKMIQYLKLQNCLDEQQNQIFTEQFLNSINLIEQREVQKKKQYIIDDNYYKNIANFMMISTGKVSLQSNFEWNNYDSIQNSKRFQYLQTLRQINNTQTYQKCKLSWLSGQKLTKFYQQQNQKFIKFHQSSQEDYSQLIDKCIQQYASVQQNLPEYLIKKLKFLKTNQETSKYSVSQYFKQNKQKMLMQNTLKPRLNKIFNLQQIKEDLSEYYGYSVFFKDSEQKILFQNYTQPIFSKETNQVFVMNSPPLSTNGQTRYFWGNIEKESNIQLYQIQFLGKKLPNYLHYVNFSFCFTTKYLILYWPYLYNLIHQTTHKLLREQYAPQISNSLFCIELKQKNKKMNELKCKQETFLIQPRVSASAYIIQDYQMLIFGGFYKYQWSNKLTQTPIISIKLNLQEKSYQVSQVKTKNNIKIKPKVFYKLSQIQQSVIQISQGIGYEFTNLFTMFPDNQYKYYILKNQLKFRKTLGNPFQIKKPIPINRKGTYLQVQQNRNQITLKQKSGFINGVRYIVPIYHDQQTLSFQSFTDLLASKALSTSSSKSQGYPIRYNQFQLDSLQNYWSPYINVKKGCLTIQIQLLLQVKDFVHNVSINDYVFPNQDSIISICTTSKGKLFLLASSEFYTKSYPTIFEGEYMTQQDILKKKQLKMNRIYQLKYSMNVQTKSIYSNGSVVKILGGKINNQGIRQNFQINLKSSKKKLKVYTLKYPEDPYLIEVQYPQIIQTPLNIYLYAITHDLDVGWCLKIEKIDQKKKIHYFKISSMCIVDKNTKQVLKSQFMKPYISIVQPYKSEKIERLKQLVSTSIIIIKKQYQDNAQNEELSEKIQQGIKNIAKIINQKQINMNKLKRNIFQLIKMIKKANRPIDNEIKHFIIKSLETIQKIQLSKFFEQKLKDKVRGLYWIVIKDKVFKKWVYIGLGQTGSNQIVFYKTRKISNIFLQVGQFLKDIQNQEQLKKQIQFKTEIVKQFDLKADTWAQ